MIEEKILKRIGEHNVAFIEWASFTGHQEINEIAQRLYLNTFYNPLKKVVAFSPMKLW